MYPFMASVAGRYMGKIEFSSLLNGVLAFATTLTVRQRRVPPFAIVLGVVGSYWLVLILAAERLKLAVLFLALASLVPRRYRVLLFGIGVLSHFSLLLFVGVTFNGFVRSRVERIRAESVGKGVAQSLILLLSAGGLVWRYGGNMTDKLARRVC